MTDEHTDDALGGGSWPDHALVGAYALDAVDPQDRAAALFERHLARCPDCQDEVASLREAASTLSAICSATPRAELRLALIEQIGRVRPLPPTDQRSTPARLPGPGHRDRPTARHRRGRRRAGVVLALAAAVLVVAGLGATRPWDDAVLSPSQQVLRAADARSASVDLGRGARATLVHSDDVNRSVIETENMPVPPTGSVYQLWYERDGTLVSAGLMPRGPDHTVRLQGDARGADGAVVTVEPEGGSERPTSEPVAEFDFGLIG
ncbi:anti-sigma factor [uncultured Nocardioides sp.]|uniref:anti-sigma factor n=1 Tax=uncultured Nocardioides sp. TaxID=198441 RepID=UPI0026156225|nr:anti-sigma factor [uncultured Nocardioides sp.]